MNITKTTRNYYNQSVLNLSDVDVKKAREPQQSVNKKISSSKILNTIRTPNSHAFSNQKGSDSKKPVFSVTRFLSNNERKVNLIAGIGLSALVLGLIYRSLGTTLTSSFPGIPPSSPESPDSTGTCPSIQLPRLGVSSPLTLGNTVLNDLSLRLEELLQNPSRLLKPKSGSPIFIPQERAKQLSSFQDRSQNTPWLLLSKSDSPISVPDKHTSEFSFSDVANLPNKHYNPIERPFSLFFAPNLQSQIANPEYKLLSATPCLTSLKQPLHLREDLPRILPSNFAFQIFNESAAVDESLYDSSSSNSAKEFQGLSIDQNFKRFLPSQFNNKISIPLNRTNGRLRNFRKIHASQKFPYRLRNIYPSFPTNSTLTSKKQRLLATLISKEHHKFNLNPLSIFKFNHFAQGFTTTHQMSLSEMHSIKATTEQELKIAEKNTTAYQTYISPMITHGIHGYEWTRDKIDSISEYMRTSLGIPKWFWNILLTPLLKPLKSLPVRRILSYLAPVAVVSYYYGSFLLRMAWPTMRRFVPERIKNKIDGKALEIVNAAAPVSGGSHPPPEAPPLPAVVVHKGRRLRGNVRAYGYRPGQDLMNSNIFG